MKSASASSWADAIERAAEEAAAAPSSEPTLDEIGNLDAREEAEAIYRDIRAKMRGADPVRFASLAEKALAAINRLEQIDARRPKVASPDEVTRRLVAVRDKAIERTGILVGEAVVKLAADRAALFDGLDLRPTERAELERKVGAMLGEGAT